MVILKGKGKDKSQANITGVIVEIQENAWMTEELTLRWLRMLWGGAAAATRDQRLLAWDAFCAHKTDHVKACTQEVCNSNLVFVPPGCTSLLQAPDLSWNKPFKEKYSELWDNWSIHGRKSYTTAGNVRPPTKAECVNYRVHPRIFEWCGGLKLCKKPCPFIHAALDTRLFSTNLNCNASTKPVTGH